MVKVSRRCVQTGMITEEENISQSEIVFLQVGTKLHVNSAKGKAVLEDRAQRFPVVDGKQLPGPRKRYNYIESVFRPQQIWQRQSYVSSYVIPVVRYFVSGIDTS